MLVVEVELLGGRYVATAHNDRRRAEWPPHPARFFSALVAALHCRETVDEHERKALLWLEEQPAPAMEVCLDVGERDLKDVYVPVNDVTLVGDSEAALRQARQELAELPSSGPQETSPADLKKATKAVDKAEKKLAKALAADSKATKKDIETATALLPHRRTRQVRTFPVVIPQKACFAFIWPGDIPSDLRGPLDSLCERVTYLGHSSSLVRCLVADRVTTPTLEPNEHGRLVLRVVRPGQLERLEREYSRHRGVECRVLPSWPQHYRRVAPQTRASKTPNSVFSDDWIVFKRVGGARPLSSRGTDVARALRAALIEQHGTATLPEVLSGHGAQGAPATRAHVAFVALPFVGHEHADASVQGCAIVLPRNIECTDRETLLRLIAAWEMGSPRNGCVELGGDGFGPVRFERVELPDKASLRPNRWCKKATRFITATPIALDRNPGNLRSNKESNAHRAAIEAQRCIADACERIGLPRPVSVEVSLAPLLAGAQPVRAFRPWPDRPARLRRTRVHAEITFAEALHGPVLLGAGRYYGLGLCLPVSGS